MQVSIGAVRNLFKAAHGRFSGDTGQRMGIWREQRQGKDFQSYFK